MSPSLSDATCATTPARTAMIPFPTVAAEKVLASHSSGNPGEVVLDGWRGMR